MNPVSLDRYLFTRASLVIAAVALATAVLAVEIFPSLPRAAPHEPRYADAAILCGTHHCLVDRARMRMIFEQPSKLANVVRIVPRVSDGRMDSFRLYAIRPGSLPARLLLRNGDEVVALNHVPVDSPDAVIRAYHALRDARSLSLDIVRHGRPLTLSYAIR